MACCISSLANPETGYGVAVTKCSRGSKSKGIHGAGIGLRAPWTILSGEGMSYAPSAWHTAGPATPRCYVHHHHPAKRPFVIRHVWPGRNRVARMRGAGSPVRQFNPRQAKPPLMHRRALTACKNGRQTSCPKPGRNGLYTV
jgi:hypothetical protein